VLSRALKVTAIGAATAALSIVGAMTPVAARGARHHIAVRPYDHKLLDHSNNARQSVPTHDYTMNHKLWLVAHAWAKHLARSGTLAHNPDLTAQITKRCPEWTAIGENVGVVYGEGVDPLFRAYMNSPEHRANILDRRYRQIGIATVKVVRNGSTQEWDVMDFGNHC
jgi:uncharacterized protein YkwD